MYQTTSIIVKNENFITYCDEFTNLAKLFKNSVIFRCRLLISAKNNGFMNLTDNEQQVLDEFKLTEDKYKPISDKYYLPSYYHFVYMFTVTKNVDYYNALPMQSSQQIIKECLSDFKSFFKAMKDYHKHPEKYTGKPKLPKYAKTEHISFDITNQDCVIKENNTLKFPKTKECLNLGNLHINKLKEVTIKPFYNTYKVCIVYEEEFTPKQLDESRILGIDLGVSNIVSTSNNCGLTPFVINGNELKSFNQWFNKLKGSLQSKLPQNQYTSHKLEDLYKYRHCRTTDFYNKVASFIVKYCIDNNIGTIIIGQNTQWKTNINIGKSNNQNFCYIAHTTLINKINHLAEKHGIFVMQTEESYTSKASFLDNDYIPIIGEEDNFTFSGRRVYRDLYKSKKGI